MMRFLVVFGLVALSTSAASAEGIGLFEIVRREVNGGGTAQLFDGGPPVSDFIASDSPEVGTLLFGAFDDTGVGAGHSSIAGGGSTSVSDQTSMEGGRFRLITDLFTDYVGSGPSRPGGTAEAELSSVLEFVMPFERAQWELVFTQREGLDFTQESMLTVENVTTGEMLVNTVEPLVFLSELTADIGDVIRVSSAFTASGTAAPDIAGFFNSGASLRMTLTIPEPGTISLVFVGAIFCLLAFKRSGR